MNTLLAGSQIFIAIALAKVFVLAAEVIEAVQPDMPLTSTCARGSPMHTERGPEDA